jgi:hypothetical protein
MEGYGFGLGGLKFWLRSVRWLAEREADCVFFVFSFCFIFALLSEKRYL